MTLDWRLENPSCYNLPLCPSAAPPTSLRLLPPVPTKRQTQGGNCSDASFLAVSEPAWRGMDASFRVELRKS